jgi:hypothetical protein
MTQTLLFDECAARDAALAQVGDNAGADWRIAARDVFDAMPEDEMTGEDIRLACEAAGVKPHHNNAWGAMVLTLVREGLLEPTNEYRPMRAKGSHARKTQVYRRATA